MSAFNLWYISFHVLGIDRDQNLSVLGIFFLFKSQVDQIWPNYEMVRYSLSREVAVDNNKIRIRVGQNGIF